MTYGSQGESLTIISMYVISNKYNCFMKLVLLNHLLTCILHFNLCYPLDIYYIDGPIFFYQNTFKSDRLSSIVIRLPR